MRLIFVLFLTISFMHVNVISQDTKGEHQKWEYVLEDTGDVLQIALPVSAALLSIIKKDYQGTKQMAFSYGTTVAISLALKEIVQKKRPEGRLSFESFPSAHTSSAFSGASLLQRRYGWKYGIPAYALAALVGVSRMEAPVKHHDIWDVLAGATIGVGSTYLFTKPYANQQFEMTFSSQNNYKVISLKYSF